jgi:hypothetical protein
MQFVTDLMLSFLIFEPTNLVGDKFFNSRIGVKLFNRVKYSVKEVF